MLDRAPNSTVLPVPIRATVADLPPAVARALTLAPDGRRFVVDAAGIRWSAVEWGDGTARPLLLVHGVTSSSTSFWRVGPALAAAGWHVVALDLPGHGRTGGWTGHHRFTDNAADVAAFTRAAGLIRTDGAPEDGVREDPPADLAVVGHSWGAMTAAALPEAGLRPARIVLLDPPALPRAAMASMLNDPVERRYDDVDEALRVIGAANPSWSFGDILAKAESLTQFDEGAARAVLLHNGDWDGGLAALANPAAAGIPVSVVRGEPAEGGLLPDDRLPAFAALVGAERIFTVAGGPHSPHRTHPEATLVALLRALAG